MVIRGVLSFDLDVHLRVCFGFWVHGMGLISISNVSSDYC